MLSPIPPNLLNNLRQLALKMEKMLLAALEGYGNTFVEPKVELGARFGHLICAWFWLRHPTSIDGLLLLQYVFLISIKSLRLWIPSSPTRSNWPTWGAHGKKWTLNQSAINLLWYATAVTRSSSSYWRLSLWLSWTASPKPRSPSEKSWHGPTSAVTDSWVTVAYMVIQKIEVVWALAVSSLDGVMSQVKLWEILYVLWSFLLLKLFISADYSQWPRFRRLPNLETIPRVSYPCLPRDG